MALFFFVPNASRAAHYNNNTSSIRIGMDIFPQLSKSIDINHTHLNLAPAEAAFTAISVSVYVLHKHLKHSCWSEECTFSLKPRIFSIKAVFGTATLLHHSGSVGAKAGSDLCELRPFRQLVTVEEESWNSHGQISALALRDAS